MDNLREMGLDAIKELKGIFKYTFRELQDMFLYWGWHQYNHHPLVFNICCRLANFCSLYGVYKLSYEIYNMIKFMQKYGT